MKKLLSIAVALSLIMAFPETAVFAASRGIGINIRTQNGRVVPLYHESHALIVGNGNYRNGWDPLPGALRDVNEVAAALKRKGFQVLLKTNLTRDDFNLAFGEFVERYGQNKSNRLLFYYAGHGFTRMMVTGEELGYLVMVDTPLPEKSMVGFSIKSVEMQSVVTQAKLIRSKHVLFMFDSCFSGSILNFRDHVVPKQISESIKYPVRQFITAGRAKEPVPDQSVFKKVFLNLIEGRSGDPIPDGYITGEELGLYLKSKVPEYNRFQHPQYGKIKDPELDLGDFVFVLEPPETPLSERDDTTRQLEMELARIKKETRDAKRARELTEKNKIEDLRRQIAQARRQKEAIERKTRTDTDPPLLARVEPQVYQTSIRPPPDSRNSLQAIEARGATLRAVKQRGYILAGVNAGLYGFAKPDQQGVWRGFDVDMVRAVAAAVLGDSRKVKFVPLTAKTRFTALQSGKIDLLARNCTQTLSRDTALGLDFVQPNYYDGQGFLVPQKLGVRSAKELDGAVVCVLPGTTTELNAADFFRNHGMRMHPVVIESAAELAKAFFAGRCDVLTSDATQLAGTRAVASNPKDYIILPEIISKEPMALAVRHGDEQWRDIVDYAVLAMIQAEELGLTSGNVDRMSNAKNPAIRRFLGLSAGSGKALGLHNRWAYNIIYQMGNYAEVFNRNLGPDTPLALKRGLNALWKDGGLMYTPRFY